MEISGTMWMTRLVAVALSGAVVFGGCSNGAGPVNVDVPPVEDVAADVAADGAALDAPTDDAVACLDAGDCAFLAVDAGPCELPVCADGACALGAKTDGISCDDGDPCTGWDLCLDAVCTPGDAVSCDDGDPCTEDLCVSAKGGCTFTPDSGAACDDGDLCTTDDACVDGACVGAAVDCADDDPCTADACDPVEGCVSGPAEDGVLCDDADACTEIDLCVDGDCVGSGAPVCDDGNPCTADGCDPETGCVVEPLSDIPCDDGNPCTLGDACQSGTCESGVNQCNCDTDADCAALEDGDLCNGILVCVESLCVIAPGSIVVCDTSGNTDCLYTTCLPESGACVEIQADDGAVCEDGDLCTKGDACLAGVCGSGGPASCKDGNPCTEDSCDPLLGCMHSTLTAIPCDDGNPCTADDACADGACQGGENTCSCAGDADCAAFEDGDLCNGTLICVDGSCVLDGESVVACPPPAGPCVVVACDPLSGACVTSPKEDGVTCDDGDVCTEGDACADGACAAGVPLFCDDGDPCTGDACAPASGCVHPPLSDVPCEDGNPCTEDDVCQDGLCAAGPNACQCEADGDCDELNDGNPCTGVYVCSGFVCQVDPDSVVVCPGAADTDCLKNTCDAASGACAMTPLPEGTPCDDGNVCTEFDACAAGVCAGPAVFCDDGNPCTDDLCDPAVGGCFTTDSDAACDDGNPCTEEDLCQDGVCLGAPVSCNDGNPCTFDLCDGGECLHNPVDGPCNDGDVCTQADACANGVCVGADPLVCEDDNPCTVNTCDPAAGCQTKPADGPCDDGDACTDGDWCAGGVCAAGEPLDCDDGNPCTGDSCVPVEGCVHEALGGIDCDTADPCSVDGACVAGACVGQPVDCADGDPCTLDACEAGAGCVHSPATGPSCEDGSACTVGDKCQGGACVGGGAPNCDDGMVCTADSCDPEVGCVSDPGLLDGESCDDGDACTLGDVCGDGLCVGPDAPDCDDGNPCTTDSCAPATGCVHEAAPGGCDDGDPCTVGDACVAGACVGAPKDCADGDPCTQDLCDSVQGCFHPPVPDGDAVECDDGDPCTLTDVCIEGSCAGTAPKHCSDGNPCTDDACDPDSGACVYTDNDAPCDDGLVCTTVDGCVDGACSGLQQMACADGNPCTHDACVEAEGGCAFVPNALPCDDGNPCTQGDVCADAVCTPGANACECEEDTDCAGQEDGNLCNGTLVCQNYQCVVDPTTVITCDAAGDTACMKNTCAPATGACAPAPEPDGTSCDDDSLCTHADSCQGGACEGNTVVCAQDGNPCTEATCVPASGCVTANVSGPCDDGDPCTVEEACVDGACTGQPYSCDDENVCTEDFCFNQAGAAQCFYQNINGVACDDASVCTVNDVCAGGTCDGATISCDDGNPCTDDACDPLTGCTHAPNAALCNDGDPCTAADVCAAGACAGSPKDCGDGNVCTDDACDPSSGDCVWTDNTDPCNDGEVCTTGDVCAAGACGGAAVTCDDGNPCTADACVPGVGCVYEPTAGAACDDGDLCTGPDVCSSDGDCAGPGIPGCCLGTADCPPDGACNSVACTQNTCVYSMIACDDGNDCTADTCAAGACVNPPLGGDGAVIYEEGFDGAEGHGWTTWIGDDASTGDVLWSVSAARAYSPDASLYGGDPQTSSYDLGKVDTWAASPWMQLPAGVALGLSFRYWADFDEDTLAYDWVDVYVEVKDGAPALVGARIYESTPDQWVTWSAWGSVLAGFGGQEARILLRFATVDAIDNAGEGIYVDDVLVTAGQKDGCCAYDSDCFTWDLCLEEVCMEDWSCDSTAVDGSYLWEVFPTSSLPDQWSVTGTNPALTWSVQAERSVSTRYAIYAGNPEDWSYDHGAGSTALAAPKVTMTDAVAPVLRFNLFADLADGSCAADVLSIYASITTVDGMSYQVQIYQRCDGTGGAFVPVEIDLSGYAGVTSLRLRFIFAADGADNDGEGIYIDDVRIDEDSVPEPGCCATHAECADNDACTTDLCVGVPEAGVCVHPPLPTFFDDFDDGDADGWSTTSSGSGGVTWFVSGMDYYSEKSSLQASNASGNVWYSGTVRADSPAFQTFPSAAGGIAAAAYVRKTTGFLGSQADLEVQWQYRIADSGYWTTGGTLETVTQSTGWTQKLLKFTPPSNALQVRIRFIFSYNCLVGSCPIRANVDDVEIGWFGCM